MVTTPVRAVKGFGEKGNVGITRESGSVCDENQEKNFQDKYTLSWTRDVEKCMVKSPRW